MKPAHETVAQVIARLARRLARSSPLTPVYCDKPDCAGCKLVREALAEAVRDGE